MEFKKPRSYITASTLTLVGNIFKEQYIYEVIF